eukprot:3082239-Rhodomonas_salina.1
MVGTLVPGELYSLIRGMLPRITQLSLQARPLSYPPPRPHIAIPCTHVAIAGSHFVLQAVYATSLSLIHI